MEKHTDRPERERIALLGMNCVSSTLRRAARAATNYCDSLLAQVSDLRISQVIVLVILYLAGPQTINDLADKLQLDRTTLGRNLRPLAEQSLLTVAPGSDHRTRIVTLTPEGEQMLLRVLPLWEQAQARMVSIVGQEQVPDFLAQLNIVAASIRNA
jgi:DNA-binding MarR family transcriptional regulator